MLRVLQALSDEVRTKKEAAHRIRLVVLKIPVTEHETISVRMISEPGK